MPNGASQGAERMAADPALPPAEDQLQAGRLLAASDRYVAAGEWTQAIEAARAAVVLAPVEPSALTTCLTYIFEHGFYPDGIELLEALHKHNVRPRTEIINTLAILYLYTGKRAKSIQLLEAALEAEPTSALLHTNLGAVHWEAEAPGNAAEHFRQALLGDFANRRADYLLQYLQTDHGQASTESEIRSPREVLLVLPSVPSIPGVEPVTPVSARPGRFNDLLELRFRRPDADPPPSLPPLAPNGRVLIVYWDANGLYLKTATLRESDKAKQTLHVLALERTLRLQRRRMIRVLSFEETTGCARASTDQPYDAIDLLTLSAGGISFRAAWFVSRGQTVDVSLDLGPTRIQLSAQIAWVRPQGRRYLYGAQFQIAEKLTDQIARFVHRRQVELRKIHRRDT